MSANAQLETSSQSCKRVRQGHRGEGGRGCPAESCAMCLPSCGDVAAVCTDTGAEEEAALGTDSLKGLRGECADTNCAPLTLCRKFCHVQGGGDQVAAHTQVLKGKFSRIQRRISFFRMHRTYQAQTMHPNTRAMWAHLQRGTLPTCDPNPSDLSFDLINCFALIIWLYHSTKHP